MTPEDSRYAKSHEYVHIDKEVGTIGITDYAQKELGDVVFVELPQVGAQLEAGDELGSVGGRRAERHFNGLSARALDRNCVHVPGAPVVLKIGAGGNRDSDAGLGHRFGKEA